MRQEPGKHRKEQKFSPWLAVKLNMIHVDFWEEEGKGEGEGFFLFFLLFRATPAAYGGSQAKG